MASMLTVCVHSQPTLGHFVNGHYAIPHSASQPRLEGHNRRKALAPPSVCVDIYVNETDEHTRRDPLVPQANTENVDREWPREEKKRGNMLFITKHRLEAHRVGCSGNSNPFWEEKRSKKHPKEQNDAVKCFDFKKKLPVLSFLPQTSANALKLGGCCGTQALFDPLHAQQPF